MEVRLDKYIWCIRLTKTRSLASKLSASGSLKLNDSEVKPSKEVKRGDIIQIKETPIWRSYEVLDFPKSRVGAKLVPDFCRENTGESDLEKLELHRMQMRNWNDPKQKGRPTKKDRRDLDKLKDF